MIGGGVSGWGGRIKREREFLLQNVFNSFHTSSPPNEVKVVEGGPLENNNRFSEKKGGFFDRKSCVNIGENSKAEGTNKQQHIITKNQLIIIKQFFST